jgi:phage protein D
MSQSIARQPRLLALVGGRSIPGLLAAEVHMNNWYKGDRWRAEFAQTSDSTFTPAWWADLGGTGPGVQFDLRFSLDGGQSYTSLIIGNVDRVTMDPLTGLIEAEGRDLSSVFIEAKTQETFLNQTSSQVAQTLATRHGMTADVDPTTTLVGRWYEIDHDHITLGQFSRTTTEWDLLAYLAGREGFDLYVTGTTLHFRQPVASTAPAWPVRIQPGQPVVANVTDLRLERALTLAKDIEVWVRSWSAKQGRGFTKKARAVGAKSASAAQSANQVGTTTQRYIYVIPNLSEADAQARANAILADLSKHERKIEFSAPGDLTLTPRNMVQLTGQGTQFDQLYHVDVVTRRVAFNEGFTMHVAAKNMDDRRSLQAIPG